MHLFCVLSGTTQKNFRSTLEYWSSSHSPGIPMTHTSHLGRMNESVQEKGILASAPGGPLMAGETYCSLGGDSKICASGTLNSFGLTWEGLSQSHHTPVPQALDRDVGGPRVQKHLQ